MKAWLIFAAVVYFLVPYDLIPDVFGLPGRIDDLLMMAWLAWTYRGHARQFVDNRFGHSASQGSSQAGPDPRFAPGAKSSEAFDAHAVLGVERSASGDAITAAYRARMNEYHPDKVAHLGKELQNLAHTKSQEIQRAYRALRR